MKDYIFIIPANGFLPAFIHGNFFALREPTAATIRIEAEGQQYTLQTGQAVKNLPFVFSRLNIYNDSGAEIEVTVTVGLGELVDNRLSGDFTLRGNSSFTGLPLKTITGVVQTIAANSSRVKMGIQAKSTNAGLVWVGGVADEGFPMAAGDYMELTTTAALDILGTNAGDVLYIGEII